jgi:hypothetical protein
MASAERGAESMKNNRQQRIQERAYQIWEREGRSGDPEDHWFRAERELMADESGTETSPPGSEAAVEGASPVQAVEALEVTTNSPARGRATRR